LDGLGRSVAAAEASAKNRDPAYANDQNAADKAR
jgi:hypothetical protein